MKEQKKWMVGQLVGGGVKKKTSASALKWLPSSIDASLDLN